MSDITAIERRLIWHAINRDKRTATEAAALAGGWDDSYADGAKTKPVSEPYEISEEGLHNLATLSASGLWDVWIRGDRALHFPGRTVAIYLRLSES
jgi:hypothetical protein